MTIIKSYKGFDKDLKCRDFQYQIGKQYHCTGEIEVCSNGFHACKNPLDVFYYYPPTNNNRYAETEQAGKLSQHNNDSKIASEKILVKAEINLSAMISAAVKFIFEKTKSSKTTNATTGEGANSATTGYRANSATTGYRANSATTGECANSATTGYRANSATTGNYANSATTGEGANSATTGECANSATTGNYANSATTGNYANSATTGNYANSATTGEGANSATTGECANSAVYGKESIAAGLGIENSAKGAKGCWLVLSEWTQGKDRKWHIKSVKTAIVDGKKIKADTFYKLQKGKFIEVK
jgi:hypothetical protein